MSSVSEGSITRAYDLRIDWHPVLQSKSASLRQNLRLIINSVIARQGKYSDADVLQLVYIRLVMKPWIASYKMWIMAVGVWSGYDLSANDCRAEGHEWGKWQRPQVSWITVTHFTSLQIRVRQINIHLVDWKLYICPSNLYMLLFLRPRKCGNKYTYQMFGYFKTNECNFVQNR